MIPDQGNLLLPCFRNRQTDFTFKCDLWLNEIWQDPIISLVDSCLDFVCFVFMVFGVPSPRPTDVVRLFKSFHSPISLTYTVSLLWFPCRFVF